MLAFIDVFCSNLWYKKTGRNYQYICRSLFLKVKYVVAEETVSTMLNRFFRLEGALTVKRMWSEGKKIRRWLEGSDIRKIFDALKKNWVITFSQGSTKAFATVEKRNCSFIKHCNSIAIPVVIKGLKAFRKQDWHKRRNIAMSVRSKTS